MSQLARFDFRLEPKQQLDVVVEVPEEKRSVIHGVVINEDHRAVEDAVVKLFEVDDPGDGGCSCVLKPVTHTFTDDCGQFLFGPLCTDRFYAIKIWVNDVCLCKEKVEIRHDRECIKAECGKCCVDSRDCGADTCDK